MKLMKNCTYITYEKRKSSFCQKKFNIVLEQNLRNAELKLIEPEKITFTSDADTDELTIFTT